jgi:hypothetical protein
MPFVSAHVASPVPAEMAVTPVRPVTATGVDELVVVPLPSSPWALYPQQSTVPFESSAQAEYSPAEMAVTLVGPRTATGVDELIVVPLPSSPYSLSPQQSTVPFESSPQVKAPPAEMAVTTLSLLVAASFPPLEPELFELPDPLPDPRPELLPALLEDDELASPLLDEPPRSELLGLAPHPTRNANVEPLSATRILALMAHPRG